MADAMNVQEFMSKRVVTVEADDTLETMKEIFDKTGFHHLLVMDGKELSGVVSDRDLYHHLSPYLGTIIETDRDKAALQKRAHQVMQRDPPAISTSSSLRDVLDIFAEQKEVTCVAIVDYRGMPVGIVTWRDLLKLLELFYSRSLSASA
jgi:acetoin utilization protein AcuB